MECLCKAAKLRKPNRLCRYFGEPVAADRPGSSERFVRKKNAAGEARERGAGDQQGSGRRHASPYSDCFVVATVCAVTFRSDVGSEISKATASSG